MEMMLQEIEVWFAIPAVRRSLALEMKKKGLKGSEIAQLLGLTKAAISQYFNNSRAGEFKFSKDVVEKIKLSADKIIDGDNYAREIQGILTLLRENGSTCKFHHKKEDIEINCGICFKHER